MQTTRRSAWFLFVVSMSFLLAASHARGGDETESFSSFRRIDVPPIKRSDTTQLLEVGRIDTDGFARLVFSVGGEFKQNVPESGTVGVILIPDIEAFQYLLRTEGKLVFPLEAKVSVRGLDGSMFMSEQQTATIAFPAYRVYLYNETDSGAVVSVFIYKTR